MKKIKSQVGFGRFLRLMVVIAICGYAFVPKQYRTHVGMRNIASDGDRSPASIQKVFDYSYLEGDALIVASRERVAQSVVIQVVEDSGKASVTLGNFVRQDERNDRIFACGFYDKITLLFVAEGISISGEKPEMVLETGCEVGENINAMIPIEIPVLRLRQQAPSNSELKFFDSRFPLSVKLNNVPPSWPNKWVLTEVKLANSKIASRLLKVGQDELKQKSNNLSMNW